MKDSKYHMNIGGASIILLIAVFALTVFAVLSIRASYNELQMAERMRDSVQEYYRANADAEQILVQLRNAWEGRNTQQREDAAGIWQAAGITFENNTVQTQFQDEILIYKVPVDYNRTICVTLKCTADELAVEGWNTISDEYGSYEGELVEIWDGVIEE